MKTKTQRWLPLLACATFAWVSTTHPQLHAASGNPSETAWEAFVKATERPEVPEAWKTQQPSREAYEVWMEKVTAQASSGAAKARAFYRAYPDSPHAGEARQREYQMLLTASQAGDEALLARLTELEKERLEDPTTPEEQRVQIRYMQVRREAQAENSREAHEAALEKGARALVAEFPANAMAYRLMLNVVSQKSGEEAKELLVQMRDGDKVPQEIKDQAKGLLSKLEAVGQPFEMEFTALDGRKVNVREMKGKVVLVDFWATWCGPCIAELPNVKAAYEKLHPRGFEILGISFDQNKTALENFVKKEAMSWPQYFDGKGWGNEFGRQFGINSIPSMWLVDKKGVLRDQSARNGLEAKVEKLLAE